MLRKSGVVILYLLTALILKDFGLMEFKCFCLDFIFIDLSHNLQLK